MTSMKENNALDKQGSVWPEIMIPVALGLYISITNLGSTLFAAPYVLFCLGYALFRPIKYSISIVFVNFVYLGFSYINIYPFVGISNYAFTHMCYMLITIRSLLSSNLIRERLVLNVKRLPIAVCLIYIVIRKYMSSFADGFYMMCQMLCMWQIVKSMEKDQMGKSVSWKFLAVIMTVFAYNLLHHELIKNNGRFSGTRDPNNFALWCNLCLVMINGFCKNPSKLKTVVNLVLLLGVIITVSVSGVVTMLIIVAVLWLKKERKHVVFVVALLMAVLLVLLVLLMIPEKDIAQTDGIVGRFVGIIHYLEEGNFSAATTGRQELWNHYLQLMDKQPMINRLFGNQNLISEIMSDGWQASHNFFIDILLNYGVIGLILLVWCILQRVKEHLVCREKTYLLLNLVIILNLMFRSIDGFAAWFALLI